MSIVGSAGSGLGGAGDSGGPLGSFYSHTLDQSLKFDSARSTVLTRTATTPTDGKKATWSFWIKKSEVTTSSGSYKSIFYAGSPNSDGFRMGFRKLAGYHNHEFTITMDNGSSAAHIFKYTDAVYRDPSSWYHFVIRYDSTDSTAADRIKLYVNSTQQTFSSGTNVSPSLNRIPTFQVSGKTQRIGEGRTDVNEHINAYLAELHFVDGQALDPSSFGETKDGIWVAKEYSGSHGDNGFYLTFQATGTGTTAQGTTAQTNIGDDQSGEGHNFAVSALVASDVVPDSPTNNFATLNPLHTYWNTSYPPTISEGNLKTYTASNYWATTLGTMGVSSGKWYAEFIVTTGASAALAAIGILDIGAGNPMDTSSYFIGVETNSVSYYGSNGTKYITSTASAYGNTWGLGDIIGVALDLDAGTVKFYKNNTVQNSGTAAASSLSGTFAFGCAVYATTAIVANFGQDSSFAGAGTNQNNADDNGQGDFYYAPPSGHLAICSSNLPTPTIVDGSEYFNTVLWTGNGSDGRSITGVGFDPDFVWIKSRNLATSHLLNDTIRGANKSLFSEADTAETADNGGGYLSAFVTDGFSVTSGSSGDDAVNDSSDTYVSWNWKINGGSTSNVSAGGSSNIRLIGGGTADQAAVQVNTEAGISIVSFENTVRAADGFCTFPHGLGSAPDMVWLKSRTSSNYWAIYHSALGLKLGFLGSSLGSNAFISSTFWNAVSDSTVKFQSNGNLSATDEDIIAYCFKSIEGYSKAGSFSGNNSTNFVHTGFRVAWLIIKNADEGTGANWGIFDNTRPDGTGATSGVKFLQADLTNAEGTSSTVSCFFFSNGFEIGTSNIMSNKSDDNFIYLAFAESPFKYANAR